VIWTTELAPMLNTGSPDALQEAIKCAYVDVLEKISERTQGASPAATDEPPGLGADGHAYAPVAEP